MKIRNWKARRGGGAITVRGEDVKGKPVVISGCKEIVPRKGRIVALAADGKAHELALDPPAAPAAPAAA